MAKQLEAQFKKRFIDRFKNRMDELEIPLEVEQQKSNRRSWLDTIFLGPCVWAMLEFKKDEDANHQPNQDYYVDKLNRMCYAAFVSPENEEMVFNEMEELFKLGRNACVLKSE